MIPLKELCARLGAPAEDEALVFALSREAEDFARSYCRLPPDEPVPAPLIVRMTAEDYARVCGAGLERRSVSGATDVFRDGYGRDVMRLLRSLRRLATPKEASLK